MSTPEVGAIVVGAGIAGLAAALELQQEVSDVLVIDPEPEISVVDLAMETEAPGVF